MTALAIPGAAGLGWSPPRDLTLEEWLSLGEPIRRADEQVRCLYWAIGDWLVWGEQRFGEAWSQAEAVLGRSLSMGTLEQIMHVARNVPPELRRADLPFWHHREVIPLVAGDDTKARALGRQEQRALLERAAGEEMTRAELRDQVRRERKRRRWGEVKAKDDGDGLPAVVWATPPWANNGDDGLGLADLKRRRPAAAPDSVLLLWSDPERLPGCLALLEAWGYLLKGVTVDGWSPFRDHGWVRSRHRFLLVGARGQVPDPGELLHSPLSCMREVEAWATKWWPGQQETAEW